VAVPQPKILFDTLRGPGLSHNNPLFPSMVFFSFSHLGWGFGLPFLPRGQLLALSTSHKHAECSSESKSLHYKVGWVNAMDLMEHIFFS
jgi:hypothetical protein